MIDRTHELPLARQAALLGLSRSQLYYEPQPVPAAELQQTAGQLRPSLLHPI